MSSCYKSDLRCASPSAHESGIFELLGSCTPLAYFFLLLKKSRSPKASKATHDALGPNALEKRAPSVRVLVRIKIWYHLIYGVFSWYR